MVLKLLPGAVYLVVVMVAFALGVAVCDRTTREIGVHDPRAIVWDEVVGFLVTMAVVPATPLTLGVGFVLFRVFDVFKPGPIRWLDERVHGGFGIMIDDVAAGVASAACLAAGYWALSGS
jgi:phosphatidylglycerophosphatase A